MKTKDEYLKLIRQFKQEFAKQYGILSIGIFGSVARGEAREDSDLDIFVELADPDYFLLCNLRDALEQKCGCSVDLVRKRQSLQPLLLKNIQNDGILA